MDYKDTLNLPKTGFPMKANLSRKEPELLKMWDDMNIYEKIRHALKGRKTYILHDGPPYANGNIHLGTALNKVIKDMVIKSKNMSGRVDKLEIKDDADVSCIMTAKDFRQMMGPNDMRSTNFEPSINGDKLILKGIGWGHGVGMCQWGAFGMARQGKKAEDILQYYYPGTEIVSIDKIPGKT